MCAGCVNCVSSGLNFGFKITELIWLNKLYMFSFQTYEIKIKNPTYPTGFVSDQNLWL